MKTVRSYLFGFLLLALPLVVEATSLRGWLYGLNPYYGTQQPAPAVEVIATAWNPQIAQWQPVAHSVSQGDGMYYFNLPPGTYYLYIPVLNQSFPLVVYAIPAQDIPAIRTY